VIASDYRKFVAKIGESKTADGKVDQKIVEKTLDELGIKRYCCRRMILSQADLIDEIIPFS
jgi:DNA-directed RNA polymerase subunit N